MMTIHVCCYSKPQVYSKAYKHYSANSDGNFAASLSICTSLCLY